MNKEFVEELRDKIMENLNVEDGVENIEIQDVVKNNNMTLTGLVFKGDSNVAPVIYVEKAYEDYCAGRPIEDIATSMIDTYHQSLVAGPRDTEALLNYDNVRDKLLVSVMNAEVNKDMLEGMPHQTVEDVAFYVRVEVSSDNHGIGTFKVNNEVLEHYGVSQEQLFEDAWASMKSNHPVECKDIIDILRDMHPELPEEAFAVVEERRGDMYVLVTDNKFNGAPYGFDKETLTQICEKIDSDSVYVIPSSINEAIVVPVASVEHPERLADVVCEVNDESVPEDEVLSDNVYFFDSQTQEFSIVDRGPSMDLT